MKNLKRIKRSLQRDGQVDQARAYDFMPLSFVLPRRRRRRGRTSRSMRLLWMKRSPRRASGSKVEILDRVEL